MFPCDGGNRPELQTTGMLLPVCQATAPVGRRTTSFGRDRDVAAPEAKSAVSDCILFWRSVDAVQTLGMYDLVTLRRFAFGCVFALGVQQNVPTLVKV